jgi:hypothetical protein
MISQTAWDTIFRDGTVRFFARFGVISMFDARNPRATYLRAVQLVFCSETLTLPYRRVIAIEQPLSSSFSVRGTV